MNYLKLCQEVAIKAGVSGSPKSVTNQSGENGRIVGWVAQAWEYIQTMRDDWHFIWDDSGNLTMQAGQRNQALPADFRSVEPGTMAVIHNGVVRTVTETPFKEFHANTRFGTETGLPQIYTISAANELLFYPQPDQAYGYRFSYTTRPQILAENTDVPNLADRYQWVIVYLALKYYAEFEQDGDVLAIADSEYQRYLTLMSNELLPDVDLAGGLV